LCSSFKTAALVYTNYSKNILNTLTLSKALMWGVRGVGKVGSGRKKGGSGLGRKRSCDYRTSMLMAYQKSFVLSFWTAPAESQTFSPASK